MGPAATTQSKNSMLFIILAVVAIIFVVFLLIKKPATVTVPGAINTAPQPQNLNNILSSFLQSPGSNTVANNNPTPSGATFDANGNVSSVYYGAPPITSTPDAPYNPNMTDQQAADQLEAFLNS